MRALVILLALACLGGCSKVCRPGSVLLSYDFEIGASSVAKVEVNITIDGATVNRSVETSKSSASIEIRFPSGYPRGKSVLFEVIARDSNGEAVGRGSTIATLADGCQLLHVDSTSADGGTADIVGDSAGDDTAGTDLTQPDFTSCTQLSCDQQGLGCGETMDGCGVPLSCGTCMIAATTPLVAETNQTLVLEGRFGKEATVSFPGGPKVLAEMVGPNRLRVVVPGGATAGLLSVETAGAVTNSVRFARTSYKLGLAGPVQRDSSQTLYASSASDLDVARDRAAVITSGPYVFATGGQTDSGVQTTISRARRNADGTLLGFVQNSSSLMTARRSHAALQIGTRLFVIGGSGPSGPLSSTESASVQADGTLGPFVTESSTLTQARESFAHAIVGKYVYVFGGFGTGGAALDTVERALIQADGGLGSFSAFTSTLKTGRAGGAALVVGDKLYLIGGASIASAEVATIASDGSLTDFETSDVAGALTVPRELFGFARIGSQVVAAGGSNGARLASIEIATIGDDGVLSNFATATQTLVQARSGFGLVNTGAELQAIGGISGASPEFRVERVSINASGGIGAFAAFSGSQLNAQRSRSACTVIGDKLYVIGGSRVGTDDDIEAASIIEDGKLGPFTSLGHLNLVRFGHAIVRDGNTIAVVGGNNDVPDWVGTPETASIAEDGETISAFATTTSTSPAWRMKPVVLGDRMHIVGGIAPDDKLVTWNAQVSGAFSEKAFALNTTRTGAAIFSVLDRVHVVGGSYKPSGNPTVYPTNIERSVMGSGSSATSIVSFENFGTLPTGRRDAMLAVVGASAYLLGGANTAPTVDVLRATIDAQGQLGTFATVPSVTTSNRSSGGCAIRVGNYLYLLGAVPGGSAWIEVAPLN